MDIFFRLDHIVLNFIYRQCSKLGSLVGGGILEGGLLWVFILLTLIYSYCSHKKAKR